MPIESKHHRNLYPRARVDALTDGIFAVAMTLLVLDIRLPEGFPLHDASHLLAALTELWPKFLAYGASFLILSLRWLSVVRLQSKSHAEEVGSHYIKWWLFYLLLITCIPFVTMVVGRYGAKAPAVWLYASNTALIALASLRMQTLGSDHQHEAADRESRINSLVLMGSALLCVVISVFEPSLALWALLLNAVAPALARHMRLHA